MTELIVSAVFVVSNILIVFLLSSHFEFKTKITNLTEIVNANAEVLSQFCDIVDRQESRLNNHSEMMNLTVTMIEALQKETEVVKNIIKSEVK